MFSGEWNRTAVADTHRGLLNLGHSSARVSKQNVMTSDTQETQQHQETLALGSKWCPTSHDLTSQHGDSKGQAGRCFYRKPWHVTFEFIAKK